MPDLPDYNRYIVAVSGAIDVAEYNVDPEDISDGGRGPLLIDVKGRLYTLADLIKIAGDDIVAEVEGKLAVTADIRKVIGYDIPPGYGAGVLPTYITNGVGYNGCLNAWRVALTSILCDVNVDVIDDITRELGIAFARLQVRSVLGAWTNVGFDAGSYPIPIMTKTGDAVEANITDRIDRALGVISGSLGEAAAQRVGTYELYAQLRHDGVEIDPRANIDILARDLAVDEIDYAWNADRTIATEVYKKGGDTVLTLTYTWNPDGTLQKVVRT